MSDNKIVRPFEETVQRFPAASATLRKELVRRDLCPECGGQLDTGWECNACQFDAKPIADTLPTDGSR
jgi:hypothetical protein